MKGDIMKQLVFENIINGEKYTCPAKSETRTIDGVDYLRVFKMGTTREVLVKKDSLRKLKK
jgi:hypothetical protein